MKSENPYPESVFPKMDMKLATEALQKAGISPDRVFGNWGRQVWDNTRIDTLREVGEWLRTHPLTDTTNLDFLVSLADVEALESGSLPEGGKK